MSQQNEHTPTSEWDGAPGPKWESIRDREFLKAHSLTDNAARLLCYTLVTLAIEDGRDPDCLLALCFAGALF